MNAAAAIEQSPVHEDLGRLVLRAPLFNGLLPHSQLTVLLREHDGKPLYRGAAEAVSIHETSFFRDVHPFEVLKTLILPALVEQKAAQRTLRIWCAACSSGQEVYSLAMILDENFPQLAAWDIRIVGTDVSPLAMERARLGRYRRVEVNRGLPARLMLKYFKRHGDEWAVSGKLRSRCEFREEDLRKPPPCESLYDLVLLRNALLYLPSDQRSPVLARISRRMQPRGYLLLGETEQAEDSTDLFEAQLAGHCYFYQPAHARRA
jgi:chemotaxis protein methyltransferase CheR